MIGKLKQKLVKERSVPVRLMNAKSKLKKIFFYLF